MKRAILLLAAMAATYVFLTEQNIFVCFAAAIVAGGAAIEIVRPQIIRMMSLRPGYEVTPFRMKKLITGASDNDPAVMFSTAMAKDPDPTATTSAR